MAYDDVEAPGTRSTHLLADSKARNAVGKAARRQVSSVLEAHHPISPPFARRDADGIAQRIDHTALAPTVTETDIATLCLEALQYGFAAVCVNPRWVGASAAKLAGSDVAVCAVVGFPLGASTTAGKVFETAEAVASGAKEIDMVIDIASVLQGDYYAVYQDVRSVVEEAYPVPVKVILETGLLSDAQKAEACLIAVHAGAAYVKTSTGFGHGGATPSDVALMRACAGPHVGVKASGGIRNRDDAVSMLLAGADRIGTSAGVTIASQDASTLRR